MEIEVTVGNNSATFNVQNPFHLNPGELAAEVKERFPGVDLNGVDLEGLLPRMVRGVYGCEEGCPADAKALVKEGYRDFSIKYIEGGILLAQCMLPGEVTLSVKVFPEF